MGSYGYSHGSLSRADSMTYQAMKNLKADEVVSFDKDLDKIPSVKRLDPKEVKKKI